MINKKIPNTINEEIAITRTELPQSNIIEKSTSALKFDENKTDWSILPFGAVEEIIKVLKFGEGKYGRGNFAEYGGLSYSRLINALIRHTIAFSRGEDKDQETGLSHIAHAGCCVLFLLHYILNKDQFTTNDDRAKQILK